MSDLYDTALKEMSKQSPNKKKVVELLNKSIDSGNPKAAYALATWYLHGEYVEKDLSKGIMLLKRASDKNVPEACYDLAICYEKPEGVTENLEKAFELYLRAALHGDKQSFYEVGRCYYHGIGVVKDEEIADIWLERAEEFGITDEDNEQLYSGDSH